MDFKKEIEKTLKKHLKEPFQLQIPPKKEFGDFSLPCFKLSKTSEQLAREIKPNKYILKIQPLGPYLNFFINESILAEETIKTILKQSSKYGSSNIGKNKKLILEHTSINPNASPHIGRARSAFIGDSLSKILKFQNYNVETHYYVNDVGKQIAMLVLASKGKITFNQLLEKYIEINKKIKDNPKLEKEVFDLLYKLEKEDKKIKQQFKKTVDICVKGQKNILKEMGIKFDKFDYESKYLWNKETEKIISKLEKTGKLFKDEFGRLVLDQKEYNLPMEKPFFVLTRKDGTSLYGLRDIAYNIEKLSKGENILVLGEDQKLYFQQIKAALNLLKYKAPKIMHFSFITIKGKGAMSTRSGDVVLLEDFMKEAVKKAMKEISIRKKIKPNLKLAKQIAYGAIKFSILKVSPEKNIVFNLEEALSFEGESSPYIQYVYARINSILKKYKKSTAKPDYSLLNSDKEKELIKELSKFPEVLNKVTDTLQPNLISNYILNLAQKFNEFYQFCPVIKADPSLKEARINLIKATSQLIKNSLNLLNIETPNQM